MEFFTSELLINLITLTFLEIILGIDNLIFIAIVVNNLSEKNRKNARIFGLALAFIIRILMLMTLKWVMSLNDPLFTLGFTDFSWKSMLLILGGLFLIMKSGKEIFEDTFARNADSEHNKESKIKVRDSLLGSVVQISLIDFVFSFDSVITAVGMTSHIPNSIPIIVVAIVISMIVMLFASEHVSNFLAKYSSLKIIALAFIFMIGVILLSDGIQMHISKGYLYFALFFTIAVEALNIISRNKAAKMHI